MIDYNSLSTRQKLNVLGLRIQREYTKRRHGDRVRIYTTEEEAAQESGFMALPTSRVAPGKQIYMRLGEVKETPTGGFETVKTADEVVDPAFSVDMLTALEEEEMKLYGDQSIVKTRTAKRPAAAPAILKEPEQPKVESSMPVMPDLDALDSFDKLTAAADDELFKMRVDDMPQAPVGSTSFSGFKKKEFKSDSDFIKSLLNK